MTDFSAQDYAYMAEALQLAGRGDGTARPNPVVGCVIVSSDNRVVGRGWHQRAGQAHAEVNALEAAAADAKGATVYVTLEPCSHHGRTPPCADGLIAAGVSRVIYAIADPNPRVAGEGAARLSAAGIEVLSGLQNAAATELNRGFITRMQTGRPWVRSKIAASLDGRTALANGVSQWITDAAARQDVHRARARSGAVLTGIATVLQDNPSLNARPEPTESGSEILQPLRVILDSALRISPQAKLFQQPGPVAILHSRGTQADIAALEAVAATVVRLDEVNGRVSLAATLAWLAEQEINDVWVEAGTTLNGALLSEGLLDELIIYQAGSVLGSAARGMFDLDELEEMQQRPELELTDVRKVGADLRLTYRTGTH